MELNGIEWNVVFISTAMLFDFITKWLARPPIPLKPEHTGLLRVKPAEVRHHKYLTISKGKLL